MISERASETKERERFQREFASVCVRERQGDR